MESNVRGEVFNVGSGTSLSVKELADVISPNQICTDARKNHSEATLADISKIQAALGWSPKISFAEGLKERQVTFSAWVSADCSFANRMMVARMQAVPSQSIAPQVTPSHHTASTAAERALRR